MSTIPSGRYAGGDSEYPFSFVISSSVASFHRLGKMPSFRQALNVPSCENVSLAIVKTPINIFSPGYHQDLTPFYYQ